MAPNATKRKALTEKARQILAQIKETPRGRSDGAAEELNEIVLSERRMRETLEDLARIFSKTEPVLGVNEKLSERDAVVMGIRRLRAYDPAIIDRNIRRRIADCGFQIAELGRE